MDHFRGSVRAPMAAVSIAYEVRRSVSVMVGITRGEDTSLALLCLRTGAACLMQDVGDDVKRIRGPDEGC
jgi:hypothetical protein